MTQDKSGKTDATPSETAAIYDVNEGARDFFWKATIKELDNEDIALDIHHIFPRAWCEDNGIKADTYNAIVNKTPVSYKANRMIGRKAPSAYLTALQEHKQVTLDDASMDATLRSHRIPADQLRADDFKAFYAGRKTEMLRLVEQAMGKVAQLDQTGNLVN